MKLKFDPMHQPFASNRYCVTALNGMVCTGSGLASAAGLEILKKGGNAMDAAVATAAALTVVEPCSNGIGADNFALIWTQGKLHGMNSSGYAPEEISIEKVKVSGAENSMPEYGWTPVTVPGAPKGWAEVNRKFGRLTLSECLAPAIRYAEEGFPISPMIAFAFAEATAAYKEASQGRREFDEWFRVFTKDGQAYGFGDILRLPDHARTLRLIGRTGADAFYRGEIADAIEAQSIRDGGYLRKKDMESYEARWVEPISVNYRGYDVCEIPPNGQGIVALMALNILRNFEFAGKFDTDTLHRQFEAIKIAFADALHYVTDPEDMAFDCRELIAPEYGQKRAREIGEFAALPSAGDPHGSDTVYLCTADAEGNMVSFIQSNYMGFGSGIVAEGYGVALQNRGADFSLDPAHYNCLKPRKRTYHTIIPGFILKDGQAVGPFGVMGGYMQPQGHVQVAMNLIDFGLNPQMALDAPRWRWMKSKRFSVEQSFPSSSIWQLGARGHEIGIATNSVGFGRGQMIVRLDNGVLVGGCESRTDSNPAFW